MLDDSENINQNNSSTNIDESEFEAPVQPKKPNPPKTKSSFIPNFDDDDEDNSASAFDEEEVKPGIQFDEEDDDNPGFEEVSSTSDNDDDNDNDGDPGFDIMSMLNSFEG